VSPTPRAAALLAVIALATVVVGPAVGLIAAVALAGATLADALAVRAGRGSSGGWRRSSRAAVAAR
jgi:hypothetical protein